MLMRNDIAFIEAAYAAMRLGAYGVPVNWHFKPEEINYVLKDSGSGLWLNGVGHGYRFSAPADARERTLRVYVSGIEGAGCTLTAHLSDGSAPDYVSPTFDGNLFNAWSAVPGGFVGAYTLRYRAAGPGQTLVVTWTLATEPNRFLGQARLQAATLR